MKKEMNKYLLGTLCVSLLCVNMPIKTYAQEEHVTSGAMEVQNTDDTEEKNQEEEQIQEEQEEGIQEDSQEKEEQEEDNNLQDNQE